MATLQLSGSLVSGKSALPFFDGLRVPQPAFGAPSAVRAFGAGLDKRSFRGLVVKAATTVAPKYTTVKPLGDRVLVKVKSSEEKTSGGILLPTSAQSKPQGGEVVAIGEGRTVGEKKVDVGIKTGSQVIYSKYAGTEVEFDGSKHLILKEDDVFGILETEDVKDLKPLSDRVLIKVAEAEDKTAGGLLLTEATKEKPSIGTPMPNSCFLGNRSLQLGLVLWTKRATESHSRSLQVAACCTPSTLEVNSRAPTARIISPSELQM
ncbi:20 kDa chaperonin, chloroplastic [Iris pallida]|uniref:20 kDa chaperonin, chloroplastic n=1 Tax=Iris pallida TaxID=29817 RepID=A0AAX6GEH5_IRIPA|nr:20 kDa chaperonin, chloroplastic [Iris pallida]